MADKKPLVIGDTPEQLNTRCANWVDVVVVDGKCYDKDAVAKLLAERDAFAAKLAKIDRAWADAEGWPDTAEEIEEICGAITSSPQQCLRDVQADAVQAGWNACVDWLVENSSNLGWFSTYFTVSEFADKVRQGGA